MINTNQVTVMACGSKRSSIWLLGALIAGTRVEQVSAQTMGFDPGLLQTDSVAGPDSWCAVGYTRFYIAGLHLSMLGVHCKLYPIPLYPYAFFSWEKPAYGYNL